MRPHKQAIIRGRRISKNPQRNAEVEAGWI